MTDNKKRKRPKQDSVDENEFVGEPSAIAANDSGKIMNVGAEANPDDDYEALCANVNSIAQPLASRKLAKKVYKLIKKAKKEKLHLRQGVTDVQRAIRKGERGLVVLAGDVTPIDVYCHIPAVCEECDMPYVFTPSKQHLGLAAGHKRPTIMFLIKKHENYAESFDECFETIKNLV